MDSLLRNRNSAFAEWYLRGWYRVVWMIPLSIGLSVFIVLLVLRGLSSNPYANFASSRAALIAMEKKCEPERNAFVALLEARKKLKPWKGAGTSPVFGLSMDSSVLDLPTTFQFWGSQDAAIQELQDALKRPDASMEIDYTAAMPRGILNYSPLIESAQLLAFDAEMHARAGNHAAASESIFAIQRLSEHIARDRSLVSLVISSSTESTGQESMARILASEALNDASLQSYQKALGERRDSFGLLARAYNFERALLLYTMDRAQTPGVGGKLPGGSLSDFSGALMYGSDRDCAASVLGAIAESYSNRIFPGNVEDLYARYQRGPALITRMSITTVERNFLALTMTEDQSAVLKTALAFCRYQQKYHADPDVLEKLVPEFLPSLPLSADGKRTISLKYLNAVTPEYTPLAIPSKKLDPALKWLVYMPIDESNNKTGIDIRHTSVLLRSYTAPKQGAAK